IRISTTVTTLSRTVLPVSLVWLVCTATLLVLSCRIWLFYTFTLIFIICSVVTRFVIFFFRIFFLLFRLVEFRYINFFHCKSGSLKFLILGFYDLWLGIYFC